MAWPHASGPLSHPLNTGTAKSIALRSLATRFGSASEPSRSPPSSGWMHSHLHNFTTSQLHNFTIGSSFVWTRFEDRLKDESVWA